MPRSTQPSMQGYSATGLKFFYMYSFLHCIGARIAMVAVQPQYTILYTSAFSMWEFLVKTAFKILQLRYIIHTKGKWSLWMSCTMSLSNEHSGKQLLWTTCFSCMLEFANSKKFTLPFVAFVNALLHTTQTCVHPEAANRTDIWSWRNWALTSRVTM